MRPSSWSLIDGQGRLFGRVNVIDAFAAVMVLGLIALGYGAFRMFRAPLPEVTTISPAQVVEHQDATLQITGENLRPALTASFGAFESRGFLVQDSTRGTVNLPDLAAGVYDLTLRDQGRVLLKKPGALTVVAAVQPDLEPASAAAPVTVPAAPRVVRVEVQALGAFLGLSAQRARTVGIGSTFGQPEDSSPVAQVLAVRDPAPATERIAVGANMFVTVPVPGEFRVPAIIRLRCVLVTAACKIDDVVVEQDATIALPESAGSSAIRFAIEAVRPAGAPAVFPSPGSAFALVRVHFVAEPEVLEVMKVGDVDIGGGATMAEAQRAVLTEIGADRQTMSSVTINDAALRRGFQLQQPVLSFTGTVRVPVVQGATGWMYRDRALKVGAAFGFETLTWAMTGWILDMKIGSAR